jgi:hypothetical protein
MADNDLTLTLTARVEQALGGLDRIASKLDTLTKKQKDLGDSSAGFGAKAGAAFATVQVGAQAALNVAQRIAQAISEIDRNLANLSRKGGAQNINLSASLSGLGVSDGGKTQRLLRGMGGTLDQGGIDTFVSGLKGSNEQLSGKRVGQLAGVAARGAPVLGDLSSLGELQSLFGDSLSASDLGDLAIRYRQTSEGQGFAGSNAKGVQELIGAGLDPFKALAVSAAFGGIGQVKAPSAIATALAAGNSLDDILAGKTDDKGLNRATASLRASGAGLGSIDAAEKRLRSVTQSDVIGSELDALPEASRREIEDRRRERALETNRNAEADSGTGRQARSDEAQVADAIAGYEAQGGIVGTAGAALLGVTRGMYGSGVVAGQLGRDKPVQVEIKNQNPAGGY